MAQGYAEGEIAYRHAQSPDFLTGDGLGWEVKTVTGRSVCFYARRVSDIRLHGNTTVLFWLPGAAAPFGVAPFGALPMPGEWRRLLIHVIWQPSHAGQTSLKSASAVDEVVRRYRAQIGPRKALSMVAA
jgi:hypothetical protein